MPGGGSTGRRNGERDVHLSGFTHLDPRCGKGGLRFKAEVLVHLDVDAALAERPLYIASNACILFPEKIPAELITKITMYSNARVPFGVDGSWRTIYDRRLATETVNSATPVEWELELNSAELFSGPACPDAFGSCMQFGFAYRRGQTEWSNCGTTFTFTGVALVDSSLPGEITKVVPPRRWLELSLRRPCLQGQGFGPKTRRPRHRWTWHTRCGHGSRKNLTRGVPRSR